MKLDTKQNFSIPSSESERDKILLLAVKELAEKVGGNITLNQLLSKTDNLTYEEIMASTDLTGKVASASALKTIDANKFSVIYKQHEWQTTHTFKVNRRSIGLMYTDDGTIYNYVMWNLTDISLFKISGTNILTAIFESGTITISMSTGRALIVVGC